MSRLERRKCRNAAGEVTTLCKPIIHLECIRAADSSFEPSTLHIPGSVAMELTHWTKLCFKLCLAVFLTELSLEVVILNFDCFFFFFLAAPTVRLHVIVSCDPPPQSESVDPRFPPTLLVIFFYLLCSTVTAG